MKLTARLAASNTRREDLMKIKFTLSIVSAGDISTRAARARARGAKHKIYYVKSKSTKQFQLNFKTNFH